MFPLIKKKLQLFSTSSDKNVLKEWEKAGKPLPPSHLVKQAVINKAKKKYRYNILVETGTYLGTMIDAQKNNFKEIYSIELSKNLFLNAKQKFKNDDHIKLFNGDSGAVLKDVMKLINEPAIFWLDGHYSGDITAKGDKFCPIIEELASIFNSKKLNHLLLIDDARLFNGENDYPAVPELKNYIKAHAPSANFFIEADIIQVLLNKF